MGRDAAAATAISSIFSAVNVGAWLARALVEKDLRVMLGVQDCTWLDRGLLGSAEERVDDRAPRATVFVLAPDGPDTVPSRGWRGYVVAEWPADVPVGVAVAAAVDECGAALELHTVVNAPEGRSIVLRATTRYRQTNP